MSDWKTVHELALAFPGVAAPARRALAELTTDWPSILELARVAREEGPSMTLGEIAGIAGVGPVAARAVAEFFHEPHNREVVDALDVELLSVRAWLGAPIGGDGA